MFNRHGYSSKLVIAVAVLVIIVLITGCTSSPVTTDKENLSPPTPGNTIKSPTNGLVQSNSGGAVTVDVRWLGVDGAYLALAVVMDTHSVDLDQYDLSKLTVLRDSEGNQYSPTSWNSAPGGHHRTGTLTFRLPDSLLQGKATYIELILRGVASPERVFKWEL